MVDKGRRVEPAYSEKQAYPGRDRNVQAGLTDNWVNLDRNRHLPLHAERKPPNYTGLYFFPAKPLGPNLANLTAHSILIGVNR